jgi:hypothetical protein
VLATWLVSGQSAAVQQFALGMQVPPHSFCPAGQAQEPPGPEHTRPPEHCALVQHVDDPMHVELAEQK